MLVISTPNSIAKLPRRAHSHNSLVLSNQHGIHTEHHGTHTPASAQSTVDLPVARLFPPRQSCRTSLHPHKPGLPRPHFMIYILGSNKTRRALAVAPLNWPDYTFLFLPARLSSWNTPPYIDAIESTDRTSASELSSCIYTIRHRGTLHVFIKPPHDTLFLQFPSPVDSLAVDDQSGDRSPRPGHTNFLPTESCSCTTWILLGISSRNQRCWRCFRVLPTGCRRLQLRRIRFSKRRAIRSR